ncbi:MAG: glycosyltransferase family 2 protein, partial [Pseudomonadota bacterium]
MSRSPTVPVDPADGVPQARAVEDVGEVARPSYELPMPAPAPDALRTMARGMAEAQATWRPAPARPVEQIVQPAPPALVPREAAWAGTRTEAGAGIGLARADLAADPPDPALLAGQERPGLWLSHRVLPWRRLGGQLVWATDRAAALEETARALKLDPARAMFVIGDTPSMDQALAARFGDRLAREAESALPARASVRGLDAVRGGVAAALLAVAAAALAFGKAAAIVLLTALLALNTGTAVMRLCALIAGWSRRRLPDTPPVDTPDLPVISIMVPLFREAGMIRPLLVALGRLDYPRDRLDVKLVVEAADTATRVALAKVALPAWCSLVVVPEGRPRTKPRALNYALALCRGSLVGILDAEDCPAPGQLRAVAEAFAAAPPEVGCVQCQLSYHNARENWISRCFHLEYAIWFDVLLRGWERLGLPVPLGGTSVYFRRDALVESGAWDAHNVTEDADLGMRLHRHGWRTRLIDSTTLEEANARAWPWIRQRSRWLKGYLLTWLSHMRAPRMLWRDLGPKGFLAINFLLLGGAASYLAMPLFWVAVVAWLV